MEKFLNEQSETGGKCQGALVWYGYRPGSKDPKRNFWVFNFIKSFRFKHERNGSQVCYQSKFVTAQKMTPSSNHIDYYSCFFFNGWVTSFTDGESSRMKSYWSSPLILHSSKCVFKSIALDSKWGSLFNASQIGSSKVLWETFKILLSFERKRKDKKRLDCMRSDFFKKVWNSICIKENIPKALCNSDFDLSKEILGNGSRCSGSSLFCDLKFYNLASHS